MNPLYSSNSYEAFVELQKAKGLEKKYWQDLPKMWAEELEFRKEFFVVMLGRNKELQARFGSDDLVEFDTWEEFFEMAIPVVKRYAQKQRETLEELLDNEI